jgi:2,4-dienoyl-CoA reductase-like NADH-dependent reductase (Old Yellow Enzyme family)
MAKHHPNPSLTFPCGAVMKNRLMLAPLTNTQSHEDGRLSEDEFRWLTLRAKGGFGLVMTCATSVQKVGKGFSGQLGIYSDDHIEGHQRLTQEIKSHGSLAVVQLHHSGMRSPKELIGEAPVAPSDIEKYGARGLSLQEVHQLREDFISAALRAQKCGYDGVEVHGAHGYILTQFLSGSINQRSDEYGGSLENRSRLLFEIINGIRQACGPEFLLGVRLSPERFGMEVEEVVSVCKQLIDKAKIDFLDVSLWDFRKMPEAESATKASLLQHFAELDRTAGGRDIKLTVAGKIRTGQDVQDALNGGVDFVTIGRSAILHYDFAKEVLDNPNFKPVDVPVSKQYLQGQGLGPNFIKYMGSWPGFVDG